MLAANRPEILMTHDYPPLTGGGLAIGVRELAGLLCHACDVHILSSRLADHAADDPLSGTPTICVIRTAPDHCDYNRFRFLPSWARAVVFALARRVLRGCVAVVALGPAHSTAISAAGLRVTHVAPLPTAPAWRYLDAFLHHAATACPVHVIGFVGELSRLKGADALPALVRALTPQYEFRIAGTGPLASQLARSAAALPPAQRNRVVLAGPVAPARMPGFYRDVDCVLVLSRTEAHCRVILEAMLAGVIVLAAHYGCLVDPAQALKPREARAERPMPHVRDSFWRGREFASLEQIQAEAARWSAKVAGRRQYRPLESAAPAAVFDSRQGAANATHCHTYGGRGFKYPPIWCAL